MCSHRDSRTVPRNKGEGILLLDSLVMGTEEWEKEMIEYHRGIFDGELMCIGKSLLGNLKV